VAPGLDGVPVEGLAEGLERFRSGDGAFAQAPGAERGTLYASYLALGALQDLRAPLPDAERIAALAAASRAADGGYGNQAGDRHGLTTTTAAAVLLLHELDVAPDPHLGMWLLDRCHEDGGFFATPAAPIPDLLSTATALHALAALKTPIDALQEPCLDFVDSLWTSRGGFYGNWADDTLDVEYTYYGLLALGHLSLGDPA
jgi:prenyltransferase beta subunit